MPNHYNSPRSDFWERTNAEPDRRIASLKHEREKVSIQNKTLEIQLETERINLDSERLRAGPITPHTSFSAPSGYGSSTLGSASNSCGSYSRTRPYTTSGSYSAANYETCTSHTAPISPSHSSYSIASTGYRASSTILSYNSYKSYSTPISFRVSSSTPT